MDGLADFTDAILLEQYATTASPEAFARLVDRHAHWIYRAALRLVRDVHLAEDVTQAVLIVLSRNVAKARRRRLNGWLLQVTRYCAARALRGEARRKRHERKAAEMRAEIREPAGMPGWEQLAPVLEETMARLGAADREALRLRFFSRKSMAEVGAALRVSEPAARKRVGRAVEKLRSLLARRGVTVGDAALEMTLIERMTGARPAKRVAHMILKAKVAVAIVGIVTVSGSIAARKWLGSAPPQTVALHTSPVVHAAPIGPSHSIVSTQPNGYFQSGPYIRTDHGFVLVPDPTPSEQRSALAQSIRTWTPTLSFAHELPRHTTTDVQTIAAVPPAELFQEPATGGTDETTPLLFVPSMDANLATKQTGKGNSAITASPTAGTLFDSALRLSDPPKPLHYWLTGRNLMGDSQD